MVKKYVVKGADETVQNVEILGSVYAPGTVVELEEEAVGALLEEGKLELAPEQGEEASNGSAVADNANGGEGKSDEAKSEEASVETSPKVGDLCKTPDGAEGTFQEKDGELVCIPN